MSVARDIQRSLQKGRRELEALVKETSGANGEPVRQAASTLVKTWRGVFKPGSPQTSSPAGSPPEADSKRLRRSIKTAVVEGVRRVGSGDFRARLFEFGGYRARDGAPQPPRPHARVALEQCADQMTEVLVGEVQKRVAKGGAA